MLSDPLSQSNLNSKLYANGVSRHDTGLTSKLKENFSEKTGAAIIGVYKIILGVNFCIQALSPTPIDWKVLPASIACGPCHLRAVCKQPGMFRRAADEDAVIYSPAVPPNGPSHRLENSFLRSRPLIPVGERVR